MLISPELQCNTLSSEELTTGRPFTLLKPVRSGLFPKDGLASQKPYPSGKQRTMIGIPPCRCYFTLVDNPKVLDDTLHNRSQSQLDRYSWLPVTLPRGYDQGIPVFTAVPFHRGIQPASLSPWQGDWKVLFVSCSCCYDGYEGSSCCRCSCTAFGCQAVQLLI